MASFSQFVLKIRCKCVRDCILSELCEKCPCSDLFCTACSRIRTEYREIGVSFRIQSECGKMRTRITPNTETFYAVSLNEKLEVENRVLDEVNKKLRNALHNRDLTAMSVAQATIETVHKMIKKC